uniref:Tyrosine-protein phosphatase domain-containing protein n=1 Tax=Caenorhabditis tropicalis TaxID=1561998 RepID=A0A1I7U8B2_9PELO
MDPVLGANGQAIVATQQTNKMSTRSTRKKKTTMLSPKKFCDFILAKTASKSFEAGNAELYKELYLESPTYFHYFKSPKEKNFSENVWLYDATRVIVPDVDYYHASWVDGLRPNQYVLAQAPRTAAAAKDFFKLLDHVKAEGLMIVEATDEFSTHITSKLEKGTGKKGCEKTCDDVMTAVIKTDRGTSVKCVKFMRSDAMNAQDLVDMLERARKYIGCPTKRPLVICCRDGAGKSGLVAFADTESDRLAKYGRVKHTDTIKQIRFMRCNTFDTFETYDLGINTLIELCNRFKKK